MNGPALAGPSTLACQEMKWVFLETSGQDWGNDGRYKKKECIQRFVSPLLQRSSPAVTPKPIMHKHITLTIL